ncbi:MAG: hypothetical protein NVS1B11_13040 [Terriglobales bacterium]
MNPIKLVAAIVVILGCVIASAQQDKNPVSTVVKGMLGRSQKNMVAAAEEMPAEKFGFKPTPTTDDLRPLASSHCRSK